MALAAVEVAAVWKLPEPAELRTRGPLVQLEGVSFAFPRPAPGASPALGPDQAPTAGTPAPARRVGAPAAGGGSAAPKQQPAAKRKPLLSNVTMCIEQACTFPPYIFARILTVP